MPGSLTPRHLGADKISYLISVHKRAEGYKQPTMKTSFGCDFGAGKTPESTGTL